MELFCSQCKAGCIFKPRPKESELFGAKCDHCNKSFCKSCAGLTTTEAHALSLSHRRLLFCCTLCYRPSVDDSNPVVGLSAQYERLMGVCAKKDRRIGSLEQDLFEQNQVNQAEITKLIKEVQEKDRHILRLKRGTKDFENEVFSREQECETVIKRLGEDVQKLNREILQLLETNKILSERLAAMEQQRTNLQIQLQELTNLKDNLLTSVETLEIERDQYMSDLKRTMYELSVAKEGHVLAEHSDESVTKDEQIQKIKTRLKDLQIDNGNLVSTIRILERDNKLLQSEVVNSKIIPTHKCTQVRTPTKQSLHGNKVADIAEDKSFRMKKILVLTDEYGKFLYPHLKKSFSSDYEILMFSKPQALFRQAVSGLNQTISEMTSDDFVLVLAGLNNQDIKLSDITSLANQCFLTNLLICSLPAKYEGQFPFKNIKQINETISFCVDNLRRFSTNIDFLDLFDRFRHTDYAARSIFLNKKGLIKMSVFMKNAVLNFNTSYGRSALRQIPLQTNVCHSPLNFMQDNIANLSNSVEPNFPITSVSPRIRIDDVFSSTGGENVPNTLSINIEQKSDSLPFLLPPSIMIQEG